MSDLDSAKWILEKVFSEIEEMGLEIECIANISVKSERSNPYPANALDGSITVLRNHKSLEVSIHDAVETRMKEAEYTNLDGTKRTVEYDPDSPCRVCGEPVTDASMGGTDVCPCCDMGVKRNGQPWDEFDHSSHARCGKVGKAAKKYYEDKKND